MSLDQWLILNAHGMFLCVMIMVSAAVLSVGGVLIVQRFISHHRLKVHNDITGPIFGTLGVIYAVLLAFVMVIVWQKFDRVEKNSEMEVHYLATLCTDAEPFEATFRQKVHYQISVYAKTMIEERNALARGNVNPEAYKALEQLVKLYSSYSLRNETETVFFQQSVGKISKLFDLRMIRIIDGRAGMHPMLWFVLIVGGVITIVFTMFFGSSSLRAKMLMSTLLAILISLFLFTILDFSFPFNGTANISSESLEQLLPNLAL